MSSLLKPYCEQVNSIKAMGILTLTAKNKSFVAGNFMTAGTHNVIMKTLSLEDTKNDRWADATPGIKVEFRRDDNALHTEWYHLKGYKKFSELTEKQQASNKFESRSSATGSEGYAVNIATGERVEDTDRTDKCLDKLRELAGVAGYEEGTDFDVSDLEGKAVEITLHANSQGKTRVHYVNKIKVVTTEEVEETEEA